MQVNKVEILRTLNNVVKAEVYFDYEWLCSSSQVTKNWGLLCKLTTLFALIIYCIRKLFKTALFIESLMYDGDWKIDLVNWFIMGKIYATRGAAQAYWEVLRTRRKNHRRQNSWYVQRSSLEIKISRFFNNIEARSTLRLNCIWEVRAMTWGRLRESIVALPERIWN